MSKKLRMSLCTIHNASFNFFAEAVDKMTETAKGSTMFSGYDFSEYNQAEENRLLNTNLLPWNPNLIVLFAVILLISSKQNL